MMCKSPQNQSASLDDRTAPLRDQDLTIEERLAILNLPREERAKILRESADKMLAHYQEDQSWREWVNLDLGEFNLLNDRY